MSINVEIKVDAEKARRAFQQAPGNLGKNLSIAVMKSAFTVERESKLVTPVDTGRLRTSIDTLIKPLMAIIAPHTNYACVYGADTKVVKEGNSTTRISDVKVGDSVLTQDGQFHKVLATPRFSAETKPDLVELTASWRKDKKHTLTVTKDHKVLVKVNGAVCWEEAGNLKVGDTLFQRRKLPHNKGVGKKYEKKTCLNCFKQYMGQGKKYCSHDCRDQVYRENHPQTGIKRREEARRRIQEANVKNLLENPENHPNRVLAKKGFVTSHEKQVEEWLIKRGITFEKQKKIGNHYVDFYCNSLKKIIEADGAFWHKDQNKDIERDKELLDNIDREWGIVHLHFVDKRFSKDINPNPIERVNYLQLNPNVNSFIEPDSFEEGRLEKVRHWRYERKKGHLSAKLYDLTVEGVHSFIASGIVISNSFVHEGTRFMKGRPFMERGARASEGRIQAFFEKAVEDTLDNIDRSS